VVTDLARGKMYEIEEKLIKDGFSDTVQSEDDRPFEDEGWPQVLYSYKVELVELPSWDQLQALAMGSGRGSSSSSKSGSDGSAGAGSDEGGFQNSALGGMLSQFGGMGFGGGTSSGSGKGKGGDIDASMGASFIQGQYQMFQQILKVTIRKVSLTVKWKVLGSDRDMKIVAFFTDAGSMDKVINGMGSQDLPGDGSGSGSGSNKPGGGGTSGGGGGTSGGGRGSGSGRGSSGGGG
jgi:hypothetical protein